MTTLILIAALALLGAITWRREEAGLTLLAAWLPAYLIRFTLAGVPVTFLELAILMFVGVVFVKHWRGLRALSWQQWTLAGVFFAAGIAGVIAAKDTVGALGLWKAYVLEPLLLGGAIWILPQSRTSLLKSIILGAGAVGAIMGVLAAIQYFTGWGVPAPWDAEALRRAVAFFDYPNAVGLFLAPVAIGWFAAGWNGWLGSKPVWLSVFALHLIGIFASGSQGAIAAVLGALLLIIYRYRSRFLAVITTSTLLGIGLLTPPIRDVILFQDVSGEVRRVLWLGTTRLLAAHPWAGSGLGGFPAMYDLFREARHVELLLYSHNLVFDFWAQFGILGLVFLAAVLVFAIWPIWKHRNPTNAVLLAIFAGLFVYGLVDVPFFKNDLSALCWLFLALATKFPQALPKET